MPPSSSNEVEASALKGVQTWDVAPVGRYDPASFKHETTEILRIFRLRARKAASEAGPHRSSMTIVVQALQLLPTSWFASKR